MSYIFAIQHSSYKLQAHSEYLKYGCVIVEFN